MSPAMALGLAVALVAAAARRLQAHEPVCRSVGYWQVSRVHALAGQYEMARLFGEKCLKIREAPPLAPFYIGYAYEALARAELLRKNPAGAREHLAKARQQLDRVTDKEEKQLLGADLAGLDKALGAEPAGGAK